MTEQQKIGYITAYARYLLNTHGLQDWSFGFDRAKARCGCCHYGTKKVTLSKFYISNSSIPMSSFIETLLHEVGHALAGWEAGHGQKWRDACAAIGYPNPTRLCAYQTGAQPKWLVKCPCNPSGTPRFRASYKLFSRHCLRCGGRFIVVGASKPVVV